MTIPRQAISDFAVQNAYYAGASVAVYEVDDTLTKTATLAPLYAAPTGPALLGNPQLLDSRGKWAMPVYIDRPVVLTVTRGDDIHDTGVIGIMPRWRGLWATGQLYLIGDRFRIPNSISIGVALEVHISGDYATDLAAERLEVEVPYEDHTHTASQISDSTTIGRAVLTAETTTAAQTAIGATTTGRALMSAATPAAGRQALQAGSTGSAVFIAGSQGAARQALGATDNGTSFFTAGDALAMPTAFRLGLGRSPAGGYVLDLHRSGSTTTGLLVGNDTIGGRMIAESDGLRIGSVSATVLLFEIGTTTVWGIEPSGGALYPVADATRNLGGPGVRVNTVFAATGTINTSDAREKTSRRAFDAAEMRAAQRIAQNIGAFQFLSAVAEKGPDLARIHVGVIAQEVADAFEAEGLDPARYGLWCYDEFEGGDRYGVRADQLAMFLLAALEQRVAALEALGG